MGFWENFSSQCAKIGKSPTAVVNELGMSASTITGWKNGSQPRKAKLYAVADYFGIQAEELTGEEDPATPFLKNFCSLCRNRGMTPNAVITELGIANSAMHYWSKGSIPHETTLNRIAAYFGVDVSELLEENTKKEVAPKDDLAFPMDVYRSLTPENKKIIEQMIVALANGKSQE